MISTTLDSAYFRTVFGTDEMRAVFSDEYRLQMWLNTEVALAKAEEKIGIVPAGIAARIEAAARVDKLDQREMQQGFANAGFPIIPFVKQLAKACDSEAGVWVHYGSTSQDIQDTGMVLQMNRAFELLERDLNEIIADCAYLVDRYRLTVMAGRTFQQHAAPITFGFKAAVWLEELLRHRERLQQLRPRVLVGQCSGAVGTLATLGKDGLAVRAEFNRLLGLYSCDLPWHVSRDGITEALNWLALTGSTAGKIANEIGILMRTEIDELREPFKKGRGGSSTMPQKRNPVLCEPIIAGAQRLRELSSSQHAAMIQEHERGIGHMHLEWMLVPEAFVLGAGVLARTRELLHGLYVNEERMRQNLAQGGGYIMAEAVMMGLAPHVGRLSAHELVAAAAGKGRDAGMTLREALLAEESIREYLDISQLDELLEPLNYTGSLQYMIDAVLAKARFALGDHS